MTNMQANLLTNEASNKIISFVKQTRYNRAYKAQEMNRRFIERTLQYYEGFQEGSEQSILALNKNSAAGAAMQSWRRSCVINRIFAHVNTAAAEYAASIPVIYCAPADDSHEAKLSARFVEQCIEWYMHMQRVDVRIIDLLKTVLVMNSAFVYVGWDPTIGADCAAVEIDPQTGQEIAAQRKSGCPTFTIRTPLEIFLPPCLRSPLDFGSTPWLLDVIEQDVEEVFQETGVKVGRDADIYSAGAFPGAAGLAEYTRRISGMVARHRDLDGKSSDPSYTSIVRRYRYWEAPSIDIETGAEYPYGRFIDIAGDKLLIYDDKGEFVNGEYPIPYAMFYTHPVPGRFWPTGDTEQICPLQDEYNEIRRQRRQWNAMFANPNWFMTRSSAAIEAMKRLALGGQIVEVSPGETPRPVTAPAPPPDMVNELRTVETDMFHVSGNHAATHGLTPQGVRTFSQELQQLEQDRRRRTPAVKFIGDSLSRVAHIAISQMKRYMPAECMIKVGGSKDAPYTFELFQRHRLESGVDIRIDPGSIMADTKSTKHMRISDLLHNGIAHLPPEMQYKIFDYVGLSDLVVDVDEIERQQMNDALLENELMKSGQVIPVLVDQADDIHLRGHMQITSRIDFLSYPPNIQQIFLNHNAAHINQRAAKQGLAQQVAYEGTGNRPEKAENGQKQAKEEKTA